MQYGVLYVWDNVSCMYEQAIQQFIHRHSIVKFMSMVMQQWI